MVLGAGHYKKALGNLMLSRMLTSGKVNFGMSLSGDTISERLREIRTGRQNFLDAHPREAARVSELIAKGH